MGMRLNDLKRILSRWIIGLFIVSFLVSMLAIPVYANEKQQVIKVGMFPYEELMSKDNDGKYQGYGFEYLQEIASYTGWSYEFVDGTWQECLEMLKKGEIDLLGGVMKSEEREQSFDFVKEPFISGYGVLVTNQSNGVLPYNDFKAFDGLPIGVARDNMQAVSFLKYSKEKGFNPKLIYYDTDKDVNKALVAGTIKARIATSVLRTTQLRVIAKFGDNDSYFATTKGNGEFLAQMDDAMEEIRLHNPFFNSTLSKKYFDIQTKTPVSFTREELDYIKSTGTLRCTYYPEFKPISFYDEENNSPGGIAADIARIIEKKTGLKLEFISKTKGKEALDALASGEADLMLTKIRDLDWEDGSRGFMTMPYITGQMVTVGNHDKKKAEKIAIYDHMPESSMVRESIEKAADVLEYTTVEEALDAVKDGTADVTYASSVVMSYYLNDPKYGKLSMSPAYGDTIESCIAINANENPLLLSVLNKTLGNISESQINQIIAQNISNPEAKSITSLIYTDPLITIIIISIILLGITSVIFFQLKGKSKSEKAMRKMLYMDPLTGYPNYKAMVKDAPKLIGDRPGDFVLIYMDMHQFKSVNDIFGYEIGDQILISITECLKAFINDNEQFGRIYADNFALLLRYESQEKLNQRVEDLSNRLEGISDNHFDNSVFIFTGGIYHLEKDYGNLDRACDRANYAKDSIKDFFTNTFVAYNDVLHHQILSQKHLEHRMVSALERHEFIPYYQPKVNALTGEVVGAEALIRWKTSEGDILPPSEFLPFYEKNGFIVQIDFAIFEAVCKDMHNWMEEGNDVVITSVNFSRRHMADRNFAVKLKEIKDRLNVPAEMLEIEITETMGLESMEVAIEFVNSIKAFGFSVSIDDYGVGYSSIAFLQEMPLDVLKLDKKFIENAMKIPKARDLMKYLVKAMKKNSIKIICEGIETEEQKEFVLSQNCLYVQGYLYSKPLPLEAFMDYMRQSKIAMPHQLDVVSITDFDRKVWSNSEDFLSRAMPGWIMGCYLEEGYPFFYISSELLDTLGYGELEFTAITEGLFMNVVHLDDKSQILERLKSIDGNEEEIRLQYRLKKRDGSYLWIRDITRRIIIDEGKEAILCACTDITDIMSLKLKNDTLMGTIPGGVAEILISNDGPIVLKCTDSFYEIIGHNQQEFQRIHNNLFRIVEDIDCERLRKKLQQILTGQAESCECEFRIRYSDGSCHWVNFRGSVHEDQMGRCVTAIAYNIDEEVEGRRQEDVEHTKYELALQLTNHGIFEYDIKARRMLDYSGPDTFDTLKEHMDNIPRGFIDAGAVHHDDEKTVIDLFDRINAGGTHCVVELRIRLADKKFIWIRITTSTVFDENGEPFRAIGVLENIDQRKRFEEAFFKEEQYRVALTETSLLAYDINLTKNYMDHIGGTRSARLKKIVSALPDSHDYTQMIYVAVRSMIAKGDRDKYITEMNRENLIYLYESGTVEKEFEYRRLMPDGTESWISAYLHFIPEKETSDIICLVHYRDIQKRKEREKQLIKQAESDPLTGLLNRSSAERIIKDFLSSEKAQEGKHAFLMIDIDEFKRINDTYGHNIGDQCLIKLSEQLRSRLRDNDIVARMGGDEFVVFLKDLKQLEDAKLVGRKISEAIEAFSGNIAKNLKLTVSIGTALVPQNGREFEELYRYADMDMYRAKRKGE